LQAAGLGQPPVAAPGGGFQLETPAPLRQRLGAQADAGQGVDLLDVPELEIDPPVGGGNHRRPGGSRVARFSAAFFREQERAHVPGAVGSAHQVDARLDEINLGEFQAPRAQRAERHLAVHLVGVEERLGPESFLLVDHDPAADEARPGQELRA